jgi:hypothetical protein
MSFGAGFFFTPDIPIPIITNVRTVDPWYVSEQLSIEARAVQLPKAAVVLVNPERHPAREKLATSGQVWNRAFLKIVHGRITQPSRCVQKQLLEVRDTGSARGLRYPEL